MTQSHGTGADGAGAVERIDWEAAERSSEFRELVHKRRSFVIPATIFYLGWFFGFIVLAGYAESFMGREFIADGLTVGYVLALSQFVMVWGLCALYLRRSDRVFDPLARRAAERALVAEQAEAPAPGRRFEREAAPAAGSEQQEEVPRR
jgi:uncharacterized membrane protein (DUF485 family)